ncbi:FecR domain-containing protein [Chitinophaga sp. MM2321]|uniref:FecR family protein n=1 Tax=Chitinophaga sp. MM2321 TaxID=3137178 RepID=UPI0032D56EA9
MNKDEARHFVERFAAGNYTPEEHESFEQWIFSQPLQEVQGLLVEYTELLEQQRVWLPADKQLLGRILKEIDQQEPGVVSLLNWKKKLVYAAAITVLLLSGGYMIWQQQHKKKPTGTYAHTTRPGSNKATLQLADGSIVELDSTGNAALTGKGQILKITAGVLQYNPQHGQETMAYNTLATPRGGQYEVLLQDGTRAFLNAASSIRFPVSFTGNERIVEMTGEVYFEVAKNAAKPFIVKAGDMQVHVLGTHFNIMAYPEEDCIRTTLAEGAVAVSRGTAIKTLQPGQQAVLQHNDTGFEIHPADVEQEMAWKDGRFIFNDNIKGIMRQIERWYDVRVSYEGNISSKAFIGDISRKEDLTAVLKMLEMTGKIHFKTVNNEIIVQP